MVMRQPNAFPKCHQAIEWNFFCGFLYLIEEDNFRMLNSKALYNFDNEFHKSLLCSWFRHKHRLKTVEMIAKLHFNWFLEDYPEYSTWLLHFIFILPVEKHLRSLSAPIYNLCIRYGEHGKSNGQNCEVTLLISETYFIIVFICRLI